ncbi:MAG TPA: response regulator [Cytophagaceae bacterium]|jgi:CheY-like chemotaxis protein|nr:response regulator [Cytophagaceae bacterium]
MEKQPIVLVLDDNKINNFICEKIIEKYSSEISTKSFLLSEEGLTFILTNGTKIKLLILDISMPLYDGWEILTKMKKENIFIPTIILTSSINEEDKLRSQAFPMVVDFQAKPVSYEIFFPLLEKYVPL